MCRITLLADASRPTLATSPSRTHVLSHLPPHACDVFAHACSHVHERPRTVWLKCFASVFVSCGWPRGLDSGEAGGLGKSGCVPFVCDSLATDRWGSDLAWRLPRLPSAPLAFPGEFRPRPAIWRARALVVCAFPSQHTVFVRTRLGIWLFTLVAFPGDFRKKTNLCGLVFPGKKSPGTG